MSQRRSHSGEMAPELFPFKFFDPIRKRWIQARYKATREDIAEHYEKWQIIGPGWTPSPVGSGTCGELVQPVQCPDDFGR